jgi:hypothetical protein
MSGSGKWDRANFVDYANMVPERIGPAPNNSTIKLLFYAASTTRNQMIFSIF